ncbi:MAG: LysM peptidoglycan-binding domain-containing protein [bacterium]
MNKNNTRSTILRLGFVFVVVGFLLLTFAAPVLSQERMKYEDYIKELKALQDREASLKEQIETEKRAIENLKAQIASLEAQIQEAWAEIYAILGTDEETYRAFIARIDELEKRILALERLTPQQLLAQITELEGVERELRELENHFLTRMKKVKERLAGLNMRVNRLRASLPRSQYDVYSVVRGDYLWKIAKKPDIYNDPWKWLRIWSYNRTTIKDPDLIYPKQELKIPRQLSRDEYLVRKGDYLRKIAANPEVYGDPFQWTKIYQANKHGKFLSDANRIYPEMILNIPRD